MTADIVALRGHHLLCMLTFAGEGYSPAFVANLRAIVGRIDAGAMIRIVEGPDDICAPLCASTPAAHCREASPRERDVRALAAIAAHEPSLQTGLARGGSVLTADDIAQLRAAFADGTLRDACDGCEWHALCTAIASGGYARAELSQRKR